MICFDDHQGSQAIQSVELDAVWGGMDLNDSVNVYILARAAVDAGVRYSAGVEDLTADFLRRMLFLAMQRRYLYDLCRE